MDHEAVSENVKGLKVFEVCPLSNDQDKNMPENNNRKDKTRRKKKSYVWKFQNAFLNNP